MQNYPIEPLEFHYIRLYREQGKLRLEMLKDKLSNPPKEPVKLEFFGPNNQRAIINVYFDNIEVDFKLSEALAHKIHKYFIAAWYKPFTPKYL